MILLVGTCYAPALLASEADSSLEGIQTEQTEDKLPIGLAAIGAGLAIGLPAIATGIAQARIGAAGIGAIAENPKRLGMVIMLIAIPETVAILGFVIAYLIQS